MRLVLLISLLFAYTVAPAKGKIKPDSANLAKNIAVLYDGLLKKDTVVLKKVLHKRVTYGHSNGWIQNKNEVIADLYNGKLTFSKIDKGNETIVIVRETATVRNTAEITGLYEGEEFTIKLQVLQVWIWKDKEGWKLLSRQSVKV